MASDTQTTPYGALSASLNSNRLADLCLADGVQTGPFGSQLHQEDYVEDGTPIITVEHLGENRIVHQDLPRVSEEDKQRLAKYSLRTGDIVFSRVGSVDRRAIVREAENGWLFSGRCLRVRPNPEKLDPLWLSYFFGLSAFKQYIRGIAVGATMPSINTKILSDVPIYFPRLDQQRHTAKLLASLDDKIEINRRINQTLEAMAQAIFKSWFVDFDPVKAKIAAIEQGEDPLRAAMRAISGKTDTELDQLPPDDYHQLATTADLFPDAMQDSELGEIPEGWSSGKLDDLLILQRGFDLPTANRESGDYPIIAASGPSGTHNVHMVKGPGVVTGRSGVLGKVFLELKDFWPLNTTLWVKKFTGASPCYAFEALKLLDFSAFNAGSAVPTLNRNHIHSLPHMVPTGDCIAAYEVLAMRLHKSVQKNKEQMQVLASLRDILLPKLLSGELQLESAVL